jgi:hypothetical protein
MAAGQRYSPHQPWTWKHTFRLFEVRAGREALDLPLGSPIRYHEHMAKAIHVNTKTLRKRPTITGDLVGVRIQPDLAKKIDDWRRKQEDLPGRPEAMRRLVEQALKP